MVSEASLAIGTATDHLIAAREAAEAQSGVVWTTMATTLLCRCCVSCPRPVTVGWEHRMRTRASSASMLLGTNDRSSLGARAAQLMEDVNAMYGPVMSGAVAEAWWVTLAGKCHGRD